MALTRTPHSYIAAPMPQLHPLTTRNTPRKHARAGIRALIITGAFLIVAAGAGALIITNEINRKSDLVNLARSEKSFAEIGPGKIGAPFKLIDQNGKARASSDYAGTKMLMIFSPLSQRTQTFSALQVLNEARRVIGPAARSIAFLWITTDPVHDTPERMSAALAQIGGEWTALTGTTKQIDDLASAYLVPAVIASRAVTKSNAKGWPPGDAVIAYLIDENGAFMSHRTLPTDPTAVANWLQQAL